MFRYPFELKRGSTLIHVVPLSDGSFRGEDVYNDRCGALSFRSMEHVNNFASRHNYTVSRIRNT